MDFIEKFKANGTHHDQTIIAAIENYINWQKALSGEDFMPSEADEPAIRRYFLEHRIQNVDGATLERIFSSLEEFYGWLKSQNLITENPFEKYNFKKFSLNPDRFRRKRDSFLGTSAEREIASLRALNELAELTNQKPDIESIFNVALDSLLKVMSIKTAWVSLRASSGFLPSVTEPPPHDFVLVASRNLPPALEAQNHHFLSTPPACRCQKMMQTGQLKHAVNIVECERLRWAAKANRSSNGLIFHASVPLFSNGQAVGIMNFALEDWELLSATDLNLLGTSAKLISSALQRAYTFEITRKELLYLEQELQLARSVQMSLLPEKLPQIPAYQVSAFWKPAERVGGDLYGVYQLPNQRWGFVIADVAGKGASAAMYMAMTYSLVRERVEKEPSPAALLNKVNQHLCQQLAESNFVTCIYMVLDIKKHTLTIANAGHNLPVVRKADGQVSQLQQGNIALGVDPQAVYTEIEIKLDPLDCVVVYTDGVTDALNELGEFYGFNRLEAGIRQAGKNMNPLIDTLKDDLSIWMGETKQFDDITLLTICREADGQPED